MDLDKPWTQREKKRPRKQGLVHRFSHRQRPRSSCSGERNGSHGNKNLSSLLRRKYKIKGEVKGTMRKVSSLEQKKGNHPLVPSNGSRSPHASSRSSSRKSSGSDCRFKSSDSHSRQPKSANSIREHEILISKPHMSLRVSSPLSDSSERNFQGRSIRNGFGSECGFTTSSSHPQHCKSQKGIERHGSPRSEPQLSLGISSSTHESSERNFRKELNRSHEIGGWRSGEEKKGVINRQSILTSKTMRNPRHVSWDRPGNASTEIKSTLMREHFTRHMQPEPRNGRGEGTSRHRRGMTLSLPSNARNERRRRFIRATTSDVSSPQLLFRFKKADFYQDFCREKYQSYRTKVSRELNSAKN
eukprot:CAMPEP_0184501508 /NCGR_PEP_ID=MMETSP0113_2-20130426/47891_1 /TAXON_ID=91329 /ORGANISM="Norrisiella sphaerica, Strain BC52" /LENGTH=357 /DNA_ID=CAMNT_0026890307 /DNA_START=359 /DNA_END=1432 /DNA_ORIENTATION=+